MLKKHLLFIGLFLLAIACSHKEEPQLQETMVTTAEIIAIETFQTLTNGLRSSDNTILESIDSLSNVDPTTPLYLANFSEGGYLLFGKNDQTANVIGFSEGGALHFSDSIEASFLGEIFAQSQMHLSNWNAHLDLIGDDGPKYDPNRYPKEFYRREVQPVITPYEPSCYRYFHQDEPFNRYLLHKGKEGVHIPAGCGPIAIATIFSHYKKQGIAKQQIDWDLLLSKYNEPYKSVYLLHKEDEEYRKNHPKELSKETPEERSKRHDLIDKLAKMIADISNNAYLIRDKGYTLTPKYLLKSYLRNTGFNAEEEDYNHRELIGYLQKEKRPVILFGWSKDSKTGKASNKKEKKAHYWVVDGYKARPTNEYKKICKSPTEIVDWFFNRTYYDYFVHCVWGWGGGKWEGYFNYEVFNPNKNLSEDDDSLLRSSKKQDGDYYNVDIIKVEPKH